MNTITSTRNKIVDRKELKAPIKERAYYCENLFPNSLSISGRGLLAEMSTLDPPGSVFEAFIAYLLEVRLLLVSF